MWAKWVMYQCIHNVHLWNDWSKVTYSLLHGSSVQKSCKNLCIIEAKEQSANLSIFIHCNKDKVGKKKGSNKQNI